MVLEACSRERSMLRLQLNDGQWSKLALVLEGQRGAGRRGRFATRYENAAVVAIGCVLLWLRL